MPYVSSCPPSPSPAFIRLKRTFISDTTSQSNCLTDGVFYTCAPSDLACLCAKDQALVNEYVITVTPCLDSEERKEECTDGALYRK